MRRRAGTGISEDQRADYQSRAIEIANEIMDTKKATSVTIEMMQHRGDLGHEAGDEISTLLVHVEVKNHSQGFHPEYLKWALALAERHEAHLGVAEGGALMFWPKAIWIDD